MWDLRGKDVDFQVWFGGDDTSGVAIPDGDDGKFGFTGTIEPGVPGKGVNEARDLTVTIYPSTDVEIITV